MLNQIKLFCAERTVNQGIEREHKKAVGVFMGQSKSVRMSEYYSAKQAGLEPTQMFEMWLCEYNGEEYAQVDKFGADAPFYRIERVYEKTPDRIELTLVRSGHRP